MSTALPQGATAPLGAAPPLLDVRHLSVDIAQGAQLGETGLRFGGRDFGGHVRGQ